MGLKSQYHCHSEGAHVDFGKMDTIKAGTVNDGTVNDGTVNDGTVNVLPPPHFLEELIQHRSLPWGSTPYSGMFLGENVSWERVSWEVTPRRTSLLGDRARKRMPRWRSWLPGDILSQEKFKEDILHYPGELKRYQTLQ